MYGTNLLLTSALVSVLWRYSVSSGLVRPGIGDQEMKTLTAGLTPSLAGYAVMTLLGLFFPVFALVGYLAVAVFILVPLGALRRQGHQA